jgi:oligoendopeptidase F
MTPNTIPAHSDIDPKYTWNAPSVFSTVEAWEAECASVAADLAGLQQYQGHLADGPAVLADAMAAIQGLVGRAQRLHTYAGMSYAVNTNDAAAAKRNGRVQDLWGQVMAAIAFLDPELLAIGEATLRKWLAEDTRLAYLDHYVDNLLRKQAHIRSAEVEELLGLFAAPAANVETTFSMLTDADFKFPAAVTSGGDAQPVTQGTLSKILAGPDRDARRSAWDGYMDTYLAHKNALASNLLTSVKNNIFAMRARRHASTLEMALDGHNLPVEVFHNLISVFKKNLPTWHRYWAVRRKALGVDALHPYDIWAPLTNNRPAIPYEEGVKLICDGLAPLGAEYVETVRRGCLEQRWVDVYPCQGKMGGAFSSGAPGTHPFIMISYTDEVFSMSTLAHELGHSMHSYLTWQNQPVLYSDYGMFVAETASNFHQAIVRAHLLETAQDPALLIAVIEEAMSNFHRYFFIMPTLARFELELHQREERGEGMSADDMIALMADLFAEGYGDGVVVDRPRIGITWATFGHLYIDYYVFQYATGISAANALAQRVRSGGSAAAEEYLAFLRAGASLYPIDALKVAGVDMTTPAPVEAAFAVLAGLVERLEGLVGS